MRPRRVVDEALQELRGGDRAAVAARRCSSCRRIANRSACRIRGRAACARPSRRSRGRPCVSRSASSSLLENMPAYSVPSATMIAPVSVARSTMNFGLNFLATYQSTSASTRRPSASVLMISMVWPDIEVTMSPGRCALPSGMFSTRPMAPTALTLALRAASACISPTTQAAPAHVALHVLHAGGALDRDAAGVEANALADEGDRLLALLAAVPAHDHGAARAASSPAPTPSSAPMPSLVIALTSSTSTSTPSFLQLAGAAREFHRDKARSAAR